MSSSTPAQRNHHLRLLSRPEPPVTEPPRRGETEPPDQHPTEHDEMSTALAASRSRASSSTASSSTTHHAAASGAETAGAAAAAGAARLVRVGAYARFSSDLQEDGWSIEAQRAFFAQEAAARASTGQRWEISHYDEPAQSAYVETIGERPVFARLLADAEAGRLDIIVVHKMDRFSRRLRVTTEALERLHRAGVGFLSLAERFDLTTPSGWLMAQVFAMLAEYYSRNLGTEIRKGKDARARAGLHTCHVPFGYRWTSTKSAAAPDVTADGSRHGGDWAGLLELFRLARAGLADLEIARRMNRDGRWHLQGASQAARTGEPRLWTRQNVQEVRRNVYYRPFAPGDDRGTISHAGVEYRGQHPAACTWDEWHEMREQARSRRKGWLGHQKAALGIPYTAEFRRLAVCADCGGALYVARSVHAPHTTGQVVYERYVCLAEARAVAPCPANKRWARVEDARASWVAWVNEHLRLPADAERSIRHYAAEVERRSGSNGGTGATIERVDVAREMARWKRARENALAASLDGLIAHADARKRIAEADARLTELAAVRDGLRASDGSAAQRAEARVSQLRALSRDCASLAETWRAASTERRIQLATMLLEPGGLVLRPRGVRGEHGPQTVEIVEVRLRGAYEQLRQVVAFARAEAV